ncbi:hypothetical protein ACYZTX_16345 [Pseudomonas sp. MDT1-17]
MDGRLNIVGKPMANLLLQENCTVTIANNHGRKLFREQHTRYYFGDRTLAKKQ